MKYKVYPMIMLIGMMFSFNACVPSRQFESLKSKHRASEEANASLKKENQALMSKSMDLETRVDDLTRAVSRLSSDTTGMGASLRRLNNLYNELTQSYDKLLSNNEKLLAGNTEETRKIMAQLQSTQFDLQKKEDALKKMEQDLEVKKKNLDELTELLKKREAKVMELQSVLSKKDSTVTALRMAVTNALLGFKGEGLTVHEKNGKVYVSMEEKLLFPSGSTVVNKKGEEALIQLAKVLEKNLDISVLIEGHTDDVPIAGGAIKDNWDLSVMRATAVVRIIRSASNIDPQRLTAAGRSEFLPIDKSKSAEARKKNRRTEIILTPKLDELLKILDSN